MTVRPAYIVNQYPTASHAFIRREILALERLGLTVKRISIRRWPGQIVDSVDQEEERKTRYVLEQGALGLVVSTVFAMVASPRRFSLALRLAVRLSVRSYRSWIYHLIYLAEACVVVRWLVQDEVTHIHAHFGTNPAEIAMLASILSGLPYSFTAHGSQETDAPQFIGLGEKIKKASFVTAVCSYGRSQLFRWVEHEHWQKIEVVHCGLEPAFYEETESSREPILNRFVCVGRLCNQKGQLLLLDALRKVLNYGYDCELVLVGDGEMRESVEARITELQLRERVRITGWLDSAGVREEILNSRALILPSFTEGLPVVIMEAMSLGKPVISTYVGGIPELISSGVTGWLAPAGDVDTMSEKIVECLSIATNDLMQMGDRARKRVLNRHDIDVSAAMLIRLFQNASASSAEVGDVSDLNTHPTESESLKNG